jgi:hypothetical protein
LLLLLLLLLLGVREMTRGLEGKLVQLLRRRLRGGSLQRWISIRSACAAMTLWRMVRLGCEHGRVICRETLLLLLRECKLTCRMQGAIGHGERCLHALHAVITVCPHHRGFGRQCQCGLQTVSLPVGLPVCRTTGVAVGVAVSHARPKHVSAVMQRIGDVGRAANHCRRVCTTRGGEV